MKIGMIIRPMDDTNLRLARQIGVTDVVSGMPPEEPGPVWDIATILHHKKKIEDAGLEWTVVESLRVSDRIKLGKPGRDEDIENWIQSLWALGAAGIPMICYNWMAVFGWMRTSLTTRVRGGAKATSYDHTLVAGAPQTDEGLVSEEQLWESLAYFLKAVVPVAEQAGVKLAMHPDDPPLSPIRGVGRIMTLVENYQRYLDLVPSPNVGVTFCQGCFAEMGVDIPATIKYFAEQDKLFFVHFRNLSGRAECFQEMFHDDGDTDMVAAMHAYYDVGFEGTMRPDHVPTLEGEENMRGYSMMGRLFAVGYMRGMMQAIESRG